MGELDQLSRFLHRERIDVHDVPELLDLLGRVVGARAALLSDGWGFEHERLWLQNIPSFWTHAYPEIAHEDPAPAALARTPPGTWYVAARHNPGNFWDTRFGHLARDWCRDTLVAVFPGPARSKTIIGLYRNPHEPLFSDDTVALMQWLTPTLMRAFAGRRALALWREPDANRKLGTIVVSFPDRRVRWSERAKAMVAELRTLGQKRLDGAVIATAMQLFERPAARRRWLAHLTVEVAPLPPEQGEVARCCVIIGPAEEIELGPAASLLSPRQREVVRRRLGGSSLSKVADSMGISRETAREYLKEAYQRTGARCFADLAALLLT